MKTVLTKFSKGVKNSRALSFGLSEIHNCDTACRQMFNGCYATSFEKMYKDYNAKLKRHHRILPHNLVYRAMNELMAMKKPPVWFRFSVSSSLPRKSSLSKHEWGLFRAALQDFANYCNKYNIKVHIPVESYNKARTYRSVFDEFGITVRRSAQDLNWRRALLKNDDAKSYVVEDEQSSEEIMKECRKEGLTVVNCPAIISDSKCGRCTSCADSRVDVILYEKH